MCSALSGSGIDLMCWWHVSPASWEDENSTIGGVTNLDSVPGFGGSCYREDAGGVEC